MATLVWCIFLLPNLNRCLGIYGNGQEMYLMSLNVFNFYYPFRIEWMMDDIQSEYLIHWAQLCAFITLICYEQLLDLCGELWHKREKTFQGTCLIGLKVMAGECVCYKGSG